jgi:hypothetical protein
LNYAEAEAHPGVRRSGWVLSGALLLMTVFFGLAPVDDEAPSDFMTRYGNAPFILEYRLVFLLYLGFALVNVIRLCWRYARLADRPALRMGLRIDAAGALVGLGYVAHEAARIATSRLGLGYPVEDLDGLTQLLVAVSITLIVVGSTVPSWGAHVGIPALFGWIDRHRALRQLYPLWRLLCNAAPEIALEPPRSALADAVDVRDLGFRLYRRVVEIRDGELALRPYLDAEVVERVRHLVSELRVPDQHTSDTLEAACLAAALRAKALGLRAHRPASVGSGSGVPLVAAEAASLVRVARCYAHSLAVQAILKRLERDGFFETRGARQLVG